MSGRLDPAAVRRLAPEGRLRAAINVGNPVLARAAAGDGPPTGASVDLAHLLGARLGVGVDLIVHASARSVNEALEDGAWDVAFMAADPERATRVAFSAPYVEIEASYLVRSEADVRSCEDVDRPGTRIASARKAAYDLHLARTLRHATIQHAPDQGAALRLFVEAGLEAAAGVRQALDAFAAGRPDLRVLPDRFMAIGQCMAVPRSHGAEAVGLVEAFLEDVRASGVLRGILDRNGQAGVPIAGVVAEAPRADVARGSPEDRRR